MAVHRSVPEHTAKAAPEGAGDIWTWVGLDADTKLVASWYVGQRDSEAATTFIGAPLKMPFSRTVGLESG